MAQEQQLIPVGDAVDKNVVDDTSMQGSNGSPIVEYPEDRVGPTQDTPERLFSIYTPTIHWHVAPSTKENEPT